MRESPFAQGAGVPGQEQFLNVLDRDEAERRFRAAIDMKPRGVDRVALDEALGRELAEDVLAPVDVPSFDRSNVDGFAVIAEDTFGASEEIPRCVGLADEVIQTGVVPRTIVRRGEAIAIATGGMMPRGADAVVMVEHADVVVSGSTDVVSGSTDVVSGSTDVVSGSTDVVSGSTDVVSGFSRTGTVGHQLRIGRAVTAGSGVSFAGTDITRGETVLRLGRTLTSRDTGVLAAIGVATVDVWRKPIVAIISTGDEIIAPGQPMEPGRIYDSNAQVLADAVRELGGDPRRLGIVPDDVDALRASLREALAIADIVLLSGGTSKGAGDVSYRVVAELTDPGIVAHGVALKPGKPICLAATQGRPVVVLPGFPTSAIFTFHEFVAPVISAMAGRAHEQRGTVDARLAVRVNSEIGRTEYLLVGLVEMPEAPGPAKAGHYDPTIAGAAEAGHAPAIADPGAAEAGHALAIAGPGAAGAGHDTRAVVSGFSRTAPSLVAYPMGQGSGSVTTFSRADGFTTTGRHEEIVPAGSIVTVTLLDRQLQLADLVVIGSHCIGLDYLLGELEQRGVRSKFLAVGSMAGLEAARRGECDIAGIHLLDPKSGEYNRPFVTPSIDLIPGYGRLQGIVFREGDSRFERRALDDAVAVAISDASCVMVNRNQGSGTRALIDRLLGGVKPPGYAVQPRNHNAVAAAIAQGRADWGVTLDTIARAAGLGFLPVQQEQYDFIAPKARAQRPGVKAFRACLDDPATRERLARLGMKV